MTILIVEDQQGIVKFLRQGLEEEGFTIDVAEDGLIAWSKIQNSSYDLILLDWMLPKLSGLDLCIRIRSGDKDTPIIFLTARDTLEDTVKGLQSGANDYIKKPFSFEELLARIRVQLRKRHTESPVYELDGIVLNTGTYQVFIAEQEVHLTQKEFKLLEFLLKNKGRICTREELIREVWKINFDYDTGIIDVFINGIRKKLKMGKDDSRIKTVRGVGYIAYEKSND